MTLSLSWLSFTSTVIFYRYPNLPFFIFDCICVFAPMFAYMDQLRVMWLMRSASRFKPDSSIVLLVCNILRIYYWYWSRFASYLLWQSVVTIAVHTLLCHAFFKFRTPAHDGEVPAGFLHPFRVPTFTEFFVIVILWIAGAFALVFLVGCLVGHRIAAEFVGLASNLFDSFTTLPPFISVVIEKNLNFVTTFLVLQFNVAASLKAILFLLRPVPWSFRVGVAVQGCLVVAITVQYIRVKCAERTQHEEEEEETQEGDNDN
jgi:hypothetical protein